MNRLMIAYIKHVFSSPFVWAGTLTIEVTKEDGSVETYVLASSKMTILGTVTTKGGEEISEDGIVITD